VSDDEEYVLGLVGFANPESIKGPFGALAASQIGRWVVVFDPMAPLPELMIQTTDDPTEARGFANAAEAMAYWRTEQGTRPDGRPNRPMCGYHASITTRAKAIEEGQVI
jgi:hypothetical protein